MHINIGDKVLSHWVVREVLGSGAYGTVYKIEREEFGQKYFSALKIIQIPPDSGYISSLKSEGMTNQDITEYVEDIAKTFMSEIKLLEELKGNSNIVCYEDHLIEQGDDEASYTIMIRMELLSPLKDIMTSQKFTENDVIKLGTDICNAIEKCESKHIIHRDIKPDNIFCSDAGDYKLGDFGVARTMEKTVSAMSQKGTYTYMAPEVFVGKEYDKTVDLYSLGIVLYQLMNKNRTPFLPNAPQPIKYSDRENAQKLRMSGETVPEIAGINSGWNAFFKVALAFNPSDRFQSAKQMRTALNNVLNSRNILYSDDTSDFDFDEKTASDVIHKAGYESKIVQSKVDKTKLNSDEKTVSVIPLQADYQSVAPNKAVLPETVENSQKNGAAKAVQPQVTVKEKDSSAKKYKKSYIALKAVGLLLLALLGWHLIWCLYWEFYISIVTLSRFVGLAMIVAAIIVVLTNKSQKSMSKRYISNLLLDFGVTFTASFLIDLFSSDIYWEIEYLLEIDLDFDEIVTIICNIVLIIAIIAADIILLNRLYKEKKSE